MVHCVLCVERAVISQVPFHIPMTTLSSAECSCSSHHQQAGLLSSTYLFSCVPGSKVVRVGPLHLLADVVKGDETRVL